MTITVYQFPQSRSIRVTWLLEEMGQDYDLVNIPRDQVQEFAQTDEFKAISPLGKFPAIKDGDVSMVESIAIMQYVLNKYGHEPLAPKTDSENYAEFLQWLHFGESGMGNYVVMLLGHTFLLPEEHRSEAVAKWAKQETDKCLGFLGDRLGDKDYILGEQFSAADISIGYMLFLLKLIRQFDSAPENIKTYWKRISSRPAWEKASQA